MPRWAISMIRLICARRPPTACNCSEIRSAAACWASADGHGPPKSLMCARWPPKLRTCTKLCARRPAQDLEMMPMSEYYQDKLPILQRIFGTSAIALGQNVLCVQGKQYPIVHDVIIL